MRDYSVSTIGEKKFINDYDIVDNEIIVNYASKKERAYPYNPEKEREITEIMEKQVIEGGSSQRERYKWARELGILGIVGFTSAIISIADSTNAFEELFMRFCLAVGCTGISLSFGEMVDSKINKYDIKKHMFFIKQLKKRLEDPEIRQNPTLVQAILSNISEKTKEMLQSTPVDSPLLTVNSVGKMKFKELKQILENVKMMQAYNPNYYTTDFQEDSSYEAESHYGYAHTNPEQNWPV